MQSELMHNAKRFVVFWALFFVLIWGLFLVAALTGDETVAKTTNRLQMDRVLRIILNLIAQV